MAITIKLCSNTDLDTLALLNKQLIEDENAENSMNLGELKERMHSYLNTEYKAYLFIDDGRTIGYALVNMHKTPLYLRQFFICRQERRKSYGRTAFLLLMKLLDIDKVDIEVLSWNKAGLAFWYSLGFMERSIAMRYDKADKDYDGRCNLENEALLLQPLGFISLKTDRLIISDLSENDLVSHHKLLSNKETMYYLEDIKTKTLEESIVNLLDAISGIGKLDRKYYFLKIELIETKQFVGEIGYTVLQDTPFGKIVGLGYFILPEFWGRGIVTEAAKELIRYAFEDDNVLKIETGCIKDNCASENIMIKLGMIKESELKSHCYHDGRLKDRVTYRFLKEEWQELWVKQK